jgi:hypothetical protein
MHCHGKSEVPKQLQSEQHPEEITTTFRRCVTVLFILGVKITRRRSPKKSVCCESDALPSSRLR